ncbi:MAG: coniferyl aldehyde dehydrogenase [Paracoccus sp. (in: a-proteobacteria)]|nr:coniferyl aldehyde dehydrogenase [Paracoccus sp. (in: a-proteobacteria)]
MRDNPNPATNATEASGLLAALEVQRAAFRADMMPGAALRIDRLNRLGALLEQNAADLAQAISQDFGHRSTHETRLAELLILGGTIRHAKRHLKRWMAQRSAPTALHFRPGRNRLIRQPLGVVGIVAPWNYPLQLTLAPAIGALAAGNRVMLKPSELTPRLSALLERLIAASFAPDEMLVVNGDAETGRAFTGLPFDHLVFTGSTQVGRKVAVAAAQNLTPVTLELGGKSPAIIDESCDLAMAAPRLMVGKLLNAGQTCIAPDYVLVPRGSAEAAAEALRQAAEALYPTLATNPDYTSIISDRHYARLRALLDDAKAKGAVLIAANRDAEVLPDVLRKLAPTLVLGATPAMDLMCEEIFGPILPIVEYDRLDDAIAFINDRDRPLALYWFGRDHANRDRVLAETISGGVTINDCLWHIAQEEQPFGGVGPSGMGAYHGEWGFRAFSKEKPVFIQSKLAGTALLRPPYGRMFERMLRILHKIA